MTHCGCYYEGRPDYVEFHLSTSPPWEPPAERPAPAPLGSGDFSIGGTVWPGLSKLVEECGEVGQVAGKLIATRGATDHWDGSNLGERLEEEMADVMAAIRFVREANNLNWARMILRAREKLDLFRKWHREQGGRAVEEPDRA